jgi:dienelactone hydrolase
MSMRLLLRSRRASRGRALAPLLLVAAMLPAPAVAQSADGAIAAQTAPLIEQRLRLPLRLASRNGVARDVELDTLMVRPPGAGPFPLAVITHGTAREPALRRGLRPDWFAVAARSFARRGWATAIVVRHGFGESSGSFDEGYGTCAKPDFAYSAAVAAGDLAGAVGRLVRLPFVDHTRILGIGQSTGGLAWLAAAALRVPRLAAVIDFAGGNGSDAPGVTCGERRLPATVAGFGAKSRVPSLWVYAENDRYFGPDLAQRMLAAYRGAGGQAELHVLPAYGEDGHDLFLDAAAVPVWSPIVDAFLRAHGLPTEMPDPAMAAPLQAPH